MPRKPPDRVSSISVNRTAEWLEADGLGGFASGTVDGIRTRRYHALLLASRHPPTDRVVLVNGFDAWIDTPHGRFALSSHRYSPDVIHPDGAHRIESFEAEPWPRWRFVLDEGIEIEHEVMVRHGLPLVVLTWRIRMGKKSSKLSVRPFLSGRDLHSLHHENPAFAFAPDRGQARFTWHPYSGMPGIVAITQADYTHEPQWYRNFLYAEEQARGLDATEDLASPGIFHWTLGQTEASLILTVEEQAQDLLRNDMTVGGLVKRLKSEERARRLAFPSRLHRSADAYIVQRDEGKTIIAGYPWFTDWGRDTFIALRGLCLATGRLEDAREILVQWAGAVSEGMLPNRFLDQGETPEFNAVDASLWFIVAVHDYFAAMAFAKRRVSIADRECLQEAVAAIVSGYAQGTRYGIRADHDGLLAAGVPGVQLTWMDAKMGDWVVTPRIGKPVEVQALWLNALWIAGHYSKHWTDLFARGLDSFRARFWNSAGTYLYDVVDVDHQPGTADGTFRPNQVFAIGGLPFAVLEGKDAKRVVELVQARLWTPIGLRSLAPDEPGYVAHYEGDMRQRDGAYHQGTVWPWLMGPFVEAWVRVHGGTAEAKQRARKQFLNPLLQHLDDNGLGHICEIADGDALLTEAAKGGSSPAAQAVDPSQRKVTNPDRPRETSPPKSAKQGPPPKTSVGVHIPRGCPFQAWSLGEVLRLSLVVLK